jgi:hypothetical protein
MSAADDRSGQASHDFAGSNEKETASASRVVASPACANLIHACFDGTSRSLGGIEMLRALAQGESVVQILDVLDQRDHKMLAMPEREDDRSFGSEPLKHIGRIELKPVGVFAEM